MAEQMRTMLCLHCGRSASVPVWVRRPICAHGWDRNTPEVLDGDNVDGYRIEDLPTFRSPGSSTWSEMVFVPSLAAATLHGARAFELLREIRDGKHSLPGSLVQINRLLEEVE